MRRSEVSLIEGSIITFRKINPCVAQPCLFDPRRTARPEESLSTETNAYWHYCIQAATLKSGT